MALQKKSLGVVESSIPAVKSIESTHNKVVQFADPGASEVTLPVGTPLAHNGTDWVVWNVTAPDSAPAIAVIRGFVSPEPIVLDEAGENLGVVMFAGRIGLADIDITQCPGADATKLGHALKGNFSDLDAAVAALFPPTLRELGITVEDVADVR